MLQLFFYSLALRCKFSLRYKFKKLLLPSTLMVYSLRKIKLSKPTHFIKNMLQYQIHSNEILIKQLPPLPPLLGRFYFDKDKVLFKLVLKKCLLQKTSLNVTQITEILPALDILKSGPCEKSKIKNRTCLLNPSCTILLTLPIMLTWDKRVLDFTPSLVIDSSDEHLRRRRKYKLRRNIQMNIFC